MAVRTEYGDGYSLEFSLSEVTGALGDSITVLPLVVALAALTKLSLVGILAWFGIFQITCGLYYGAPLSVEPMKALAALAIAGVLTTGELLIAGLLAGIILLGIGATGVLASVERYIGEPVIRGIQLAVALLLLKTGIQLGLRNLFLAGVAVTIVLFVSLLGYRRLSPLIVLGVGAVFALAETGIPTVHVPIDAFISPLSLTAVSLSSIEATIGQLAMTVGNAAVATSVLLADFFDREISADDLSLSMGVMNVVAVPFGGLPMCHGSGGVAGKYAFGARTAGANVILGIGYLLVAIAAVSLVVAFPMALLGVILVIVATHLATAGLKSSTLSLTLGVGILGAATNIGLAFIVGILTHRLWKWYAD